MYDLKTDTEFPLTSFINDYAEGKLDAVEISAFKEFLSYDSELSSFVDNTMQGRLALKNAYKVTAADDFEEKLKRRIVRETAGIDYASHSTKQEYTSA